MKIRMFISMNLIGCERSDTIEISDKEWNSMSNDEQEEMLSEYANSFLNNYVEYGANIEES